MELWGAVLMLSASLAGGTACIDSAPLLAGSRGGCYGGGGVGFGFNSLPWDFESKTRLLRLSNGTSGCHAGLDAARSPSISRGT